MRMILFWFALVIILSVNVARGAGDLLTEITFDDGTLKSATTNKKQASLNPEWKGKPVFSEGIHGKALLLSGQSLEFPLTNVIDCRQGTISFWIKPINWSNSTQGMTRIWHVGAPRWAGKGMHLYFYKGTRNGGFSFRVEQRQGFRGFSDDYVSTRAGLPLPQKWLHFAMTWSDIEQRLFVNGKRVARRYYGLPIPLKPVPGSYRMVFMENRQRTTALDELRTYSRPLHDAQILELYQQYAGDSVAAKKPSIIPVPRLTHPVTLDGKLTPAEWADASRAPLMKMLYSNSLSPVPAWLYVKYDDQTLYLGYEIAYAGKLYTPVRGRETNTITGKHICLGDEVEFHCRLSSSTEEQYHQFFAAPNNSYGYLKSESYKRKLWNAPTSFRSATHVEKNRWTAEMAVSLKEIGFDPKKGAVLNANAGLHRPHDERIPGDATNRWHGWSGGDGRLFIAPESMGRFIFMPDNTAVRIRQFGDPHYGKLKLGVEARGKDNVSLSVTMQDLDKKHPFTRALPLGREPAELTTAIQWKGYGELLAEAVSAEKNKTIFRFGSRLFVREPVSFTFKTIPSRKQIRAEVDLAGLKGKYPRELAEGKASLHISLVAKDGKTLGETRIVPRDFTVEAYVPMGELPLGTYTVKLALEIGGETYRLSKSFERPDPVFLDNRKGIDRNVPAPWIPVRKEGQTIRVLNRRYVFGKGPFPLQAISKGVSVLAGEPELIVAVKGRTCRFTPETSADAETANDRLVSTGTSIAEKAGLRLQWTRRIDYDGLIRYDCSLVPVKGRVTVDRMELKIRVPAEVSRSAITIAGFSRAWVKSSKTGISAFPLVWLTNDMAGMAFFTDSDANWVYSSGKMPIKVFRSKGEAIISGQIITSPVTVRTPLRYTFGLMATPAKPPRRGIYNGVRENAESRNRNLRVVGWPGNPDMYFSKQGWLLTDPLFPDKYRNKLKYWAGKGVRCVPYACGSTMPTNNPIFDFYGEDWLIRQQGRKLALHSTISGWQCKYQHAPVCASSGFADYMAYYLDKYLTNMDLHGLYLDFASAKQSDNIANGQPRKDDLRPDRLPLSYNVFAMRGMYERFYKIIHQHRPDGYLFLHSRDKFHPALISFADIVCPGEEYQLTAPKHPELYLDDVPLEKWQTCCYSPALGANVQFLAQSATPQVRKSLKLSLEGQRLRSIPMITACLLHDTVMYGFATIGNVREIKLRNKVDEATFNPYWRQKEIITGDAKVLCSYYTWKGEKRRLIMLGNWHKEQKAVTLRFSAGDQKNITAVDEETSKAIDLSQPLVVKGYNYRIIQMRW